MSNSILSELEPYFFLKIWAKNDFTCLHTYFLLRKTYMIFFTAQQILSSSNRQGAVLVHQGMQQRKYSPCLEGARRLPLGRRERIPEYKSHRKAVSKMAWFRGVGSHVELQECQKRIRGGDSRDRPWRMSSAPLGRGYTWRWALSSRKASGIVYLDQEVCVERQRWQAGSRLENHSTIYKACTESGSQGRPAGEL